MLQTLFIQNYALIERLDIDFFPGFSVITGETGAGKSIMLGAIGLLMGQRADIKSIRSGANKCIVEASFDISKYPVDDFFQENEIDNDGEECILRRELYATGKSRAFINDTPVSLSQIKELGEMLLDVHSQHQNFLLNHEDFQLNILDSLSDNKENKTSYQDTYKQYQDVCTELDNLIEEGDKNRQNEDFMRYQWQELHDAHLKDGEQIELEEEEKVLSHAEEIKSFLYQTKMALSDEESGTLSQLKQCIQYMNKLSSIYIPAREWTERLKTCYIELNDLQDTISDEEDEVEFNPTRLNYINERLNLIYNLEQKHHVEDVSDLLDIEDELKEKLDSIISLDDKIEILEKRKEALFEQVKTLGNALSNTRKESAKIIEKKMTDYLVSLGMPHAKFVVEISERKSPSIKGTDNVAYIFSANKNGVLQPLSSIASGGEIARVMLSLKAIMSEAMNLPTIIFDEIDTGVSGPIAERMAFIMRKMSKNKRQVISITHLPQIAAKGELHYKVYKEDTETQTNSHIKLLKEEDRINEIAFMLSGASLSDAALDNAKALLKNK